MNADALFVMSLQQRFGVYSVELTTQAKHFFRYHDEAGVPRTVMVPVLIFCYENARVEKALPMKLAQEWITGSHGVAMQRITAECAWSQVDIEKYIASTVADLRDNILVKGHA
jgi:hypothetical protein